MSPKALAGSAVCIALFASTAFAERLPVTVRMRVTEHGRQHVRVFDAIEGTLRPDGKFSGRVAISGRDWSAQALVYGQFVIDRPALAPRGTVGIIDVRGALGLAMGSLGATDFSADVCIDEVFDNLGFSIPLVDVTNAVYGGSVAGAFVDANADTDPTAASMFVEAADPPMYRLFVDTDTCDPNGPPPTPSPDTDTSPTNVQTLRNAPQTFSCGTPFCGGTISEEFFPAAGGIPSQTGPNIPRSFELRGHYSDGDGDIGVLTAVAAMRGTMNASAVVAEPLFVNSPRNLGRAADADLAPRFLLSVSGLNILGLITLEIDGPSGSSVGQLSESQTTGLPIGPLTRNGGTFAGSLSDFGLPDVLNPPAVSRGISPVCRLAQISTFPIYRGMIDPTPVPTVPDTAEQEFPLYPPPGPTPPPFDILVPFRSIVIPAQSFGGPFTPAPSLIGPQADNELRVEHNYQLFSECVLGLASVYVVPQQGVVPTPSNTPSPTATWTATPSSTPTLTNTPTLTDTPTETLTPSNTPTATDTLTATNTPTASSTPTLTDTPTPSNTATASDTPSATPTISATPTQTSTQTPSNTLTPSSTLTPSNTPTITTTPEISVPVAPAIPTLSGAGIGLLLLLLVGTGLVFLLRGRGQG